MGVIVFHNPESKAGKRLRSIITAAHPDLTVAYLHTVSGLLDTLTHPGSGGSILVLQAADDRALDALISSGEWLTDFRIILILPDQRSHTISMGHLLCPRFVTFADGELDHVGLVLARLLSLSDRNLWVN